MTPAPLVDDFAAPRGGASDEETKSNEEGTAKAAPCPCTSRPLPPR